MAQTPAIYRQRGDNIDYTPVGATLAGTVVQIGNIVTIVPVAIAAGEKGATTTRGVFDVPKDNSDVSEGDTLYWNPTGNPVGGTGGSGAFTTTVIPAGIAGTALADAGVGVGTVSMLLHSLDSALQASFGPVSVATVVVGADNTQLNANAVGVGFSLVTGADNTKAVKLPAAAAGKVCIIKNAEAASVLLVFPASGGKINGGAANAVYNHGDGAQRMYIAYNAVDWFAPDENENA